MRIKLHFKLSIRGSAATTGPGPSTLQPCALPSCFLVLWAQRIGEPPSIRTRLQLYRLLYSEPMYSLDRRDCERRSCMITKRLEATRTGWFRGV
nr:hypothetical protein CFP56_04360 [Quercus suber]